VLDGLGVSAGGQLAPRILYSDVIEAITDQHTIIINRNREASMVLPGESLLAMSMIGAAGRLYLSGTTQDVLTAREAVTKVLTDIAGRHS
jgi:hypothetical protein